MEDIRSEMPPDDRLQDRVYLHRRKSDIIVQEKKWLRLNLTQEKLAEAIHISTAYLGQIEREERNITFRKINSYGKPTRSALQTGWKYVANRLGVAADVMSP